MRSTRTGWGLLAPTLVILGFVGIVPFLYVIYIGFFDWDIFAAKIGMVFAGVNNYRRLVFDSEYLAALGRTLQFMVWVVISELILGFVLAQLLTRRNFWGRSVFRTIHALPLVVAPIAVGATWRLFTVPGFGPLPYYLDKWFGLEYSISRYASHAFTTIVLMDIWHWTPFVTLTLVAGLTALPKEPFEQALVDGANRWQVFRYLTLPLLTPVLVTTTFIRIMDALRVVDEVWMLTGGGPGTSTRFVGLHIWLVVFPKTAYGYGAAMSLLTLYFTIVLSWLLFIAITQSGRHTAS